jgi:hypothetical protein
MEQLLSFRLSMDRRVSVLWKWEAGAVSARAPRRTQPVFDPELLAGTLLP